MYLTLLNFLCLSLISGQITYPDIYVLVPLWPDNRGQTVMMLLCLQIHTIRE